MCDEQARCVGGHVSNDGEHVHHYEVCDPYYSDHDHKNGEPSNDRGDAAHMIRLSILTRMMGEFQLYGDHVQKNGACAPNKGVLITVRMLLILVRLTICPAGMIMYYGERAHNYGGCNRDAGDHERRDANHALVCILSG